MADYDDAERDQMMNGIEAADQVHLANGGSNSAGGATVYVGAADLLVGPQDLGHVPDDYGHHHLDDPSSAANQALLCNSGTPDPKILSPRDPHRKTIDEDDEEWSGATRCGFGFLLLLALVLIWGAAVLVIFWAVYYRRGFAWKDGDLHKLFNLHPVLMIGGFIFFMGQSLLVYRSFRCCKRVYNKLAHTVLHLLAVPCIVVGFLAVFEYHDLYSPPIPHFYSLHSWLGLVTMGLFALQFVVGFFSFLILLCCEGATGAFRAALVPIHGTMGLTIFMLGIATAVTGITEKAIFSLNGKNETVHYKDMPEEGIILNALGVALAALAIVVPQILYRETYRYRRVTHLLISNDRL